MTKKKLQYSHDGETEYYLTLLQNYILPNLTPRQMKKIWRTDRLLYATLKAWKEK